MTRRLEKIGGAVHAVSAAGCQGAVGLSPPPLCSSQCSTLYACGQLYIIPGQTSTLSEMSKLNDRISQQLFKILYINTVEIVYNETGYNEQPDITSNFGAEVRSRI